MKKLSSEDKAGIYITVIVHLTVLIVFLLLQIGRAVKKENSFVIDFSREEALEKKKLEEKRIEEENSFNEAISKRLDELISGADASKFRNIAVDRSSILKDDRNTDAEKLYADAERLAAELKSGVVPDEPDEDYVPIASGVLRVMHADPHGTEACVIGQTTAEAPGEVGLRTALGGIRVVDMPLGELVPRIC